MNALARAFQDIFDPPPRPLPECDQWKLVIAMPLLERMDTLGLGWHDEETVCGGEVGMSIIGARCFWAKELGLIEYRHRFMRGGWWIRLTPLGRRTLRHS